MERNLGVPTRQKTCRNQIISIPVQYMERAFQAASDFKAFLSISGFVPKESRLYLSQDPSNVKGVSLYSTGSEQTRSYCEKL